MSRKPRQDARIEYHEVGWAPDSTITGKKHFWTCGKPICRADVSPPYRDRRKLEEAHLALCEDCDRITRMMGTKEAQEGR